MNGWFQAMLFTSIITKINRIANDAYKFIVQYFELYSTEFTKRLERAVQTNELFRRENLVFFSLSSE